MAEAVAGTVADGVARRPVTGAGCMIMSRRTGRFLFCLRPQEASCGGVWSLWGGKSEDGENASATALREVREETGFAGGGEMSHLHRIDTRTFRYDSFLLVVEDEFEPLPSREWAEWKWAPVEDAPVPMHWGLLELLRDRTAAGLIVRAVEGLSGRPCPFRHDRAG